MKKYNFVIISLIILSSCGKKASNKNIRLDLFKRFVNSRSLGKIPINKPKTNFLKQKFGALRTTGIIGTSLGFSYLYNQNSLLCDSSKKVHSNNINFLADSLSSSILNQDTSIDYSNPDIYNCVLSEGNNRFYGDLNSQSKKVFDFSIPMSYLQNATINEPIHYPTNDSFNNRTSDTNNNYGSIDSKEDNIKKWILRKKLSVDTRVNNWRDDLVCGIKKACWGQTFLRSIDNEGKIVNGPIKGDFILCSDQIIENSKYPNIKKWNFIKNSCIYCSVTQLKCIHVPNTFHKRCNNMGGIHGIEVSTLLLRNFSNLDKNRKINVILATGIEDKLGCNITSIHELISKNDFKNLTVYSVPSINACELFNELMDNRSSDVNVMFYHSTC